MCGRLRASAHGVALSVDGERELIEVVLSFLFRVFGVAASRSAVDAGGE